MFAGNFETSMVIERIIIKLYMETKINKELVNLFFSKLAKLFKYFFPGIVLLELFFKQGLFSTPPSNIYSFFIYLFWCGILSLPFHLIQPSCIDSFFNNLLAFISKTRNIEKTILEAMFKGKDESEDELEEFELGFILIKLFLMYIIYKLLNIILMSDLKFIGISGIILKLFINIIIVSVLSYPIGYIYSVICMRIIRSRFYKT
jgi:hypothetical protein